MIDCGWTSDRACRVFNLMLMCVLKQMFFLTCCRSVGRGMAGGGGGTGSLAAAAGPGGGPSGGSVAAGSQEQQGRLAAVRAGEQPGVHWAGSQQRGGTETARMEPNILILKQNCFNLKTLANIHQESQRLAVWRWQFSQSEAFFCCFNGKQGSCIFSKKAPDCIF